MEDVVIGEKAKLMPEVKRPWWKGPKPREEVEIEELWRMNAVDAKGKATTIGWGLVFGAGLACKTVRQVRAARAAAPFATALPSP